MQAAFEACAATDEELAAYAETARRDGMARHCVKAWAVPEGPN